MTDKPRLARGRPTNFRPSFGEEILTLMTEGLSLAAAAAAIGIHRQRVYDWVNQHPEFADTIKLATAKRQLFLERRLLAASEGPVVTSTIFALKNAAGEDWREKSQVDHGVTDTLAELLKEIDGQSRGLPADR